MVEEGKVVVVRRQQTKPEMSLCTQGLLCFYDIVPSIKLNLETKALFEVYGMVKY